MDNDVSRTPYFHNCDIECKVDRSFWAKQIGVNPKALLNEKFQAEYPFDLNLHKTNNGIMHYLDVGAGHPVVMVHGNPTWSFFYRNVIKALQNNHRCIVPDHVGCGLSEKSNDFTDYTLEDHIDDLESLLENILPPEGEKGGTFDLIIHDWGGTIGLGYALRHPKRIRRLVVLNTSAFKEGDMPFAIKLSRTPVIGQFLVQGLNLFCLGGLWFTTRKRMPRVVKKGFILPYNSYTNRAAVYGFVRDIPLSHSGATWDLLSNIDDGLKELLADIPILIQWGAKDWCFTPEFLKLWQRRFPGAELNKYTAGHYLLEDAGEKIIDRIRDFLERK